MQPSNEPGSLQLVTLKKPSRQAHTVNYSFPVCVYGSRSEGYILPPV